MSVSVSIEMLKAQWLLYNKVSSSFSTIDTRKTYMSLAHLAAYGFYPRQHSFHVLYCCHPLELLLDALRLGQQAPPVCNLVQTLSD